MSDVCLVRERGERFRVFRFPREEREFLERKFILTLRVSCTEGGQLGTMETSSILLLGQQQLLSKTTGTTKVVWNGGFCKTKNSMQTYPRLKGPDFFQDSYNLNYLFVVARKRATSPESFQRILGTTHRTFALQIVNRVSIIQKLALTLNVTTPWYNSTLK